VLRFRLMVKRGPCVRPQASEGEAQQASARPALIAGDDRRDGWRILKAAADNVRDKRKAQNRA